MSKKYYSTDKETGRGTATRQNLSTKINVFLRVNDGESFGFHNSLFHGLGHLYVCDSCVISIKEAWEKAENHLDGNV